MLTLGATLFPIAVTNDEVRGYISFSTGDLVKFCLLCGGCTGAGDSFLSGCVADLCGLSIRWCGGGPGGGGGILDCRC